MPATFFFRWFDDIRLKDPPPCRHLRRGVGELSGNCALPRRTGHQLAIGVNAPSLLRTMTVVHEAEQMAARAPAAAQ